MAISLKKIIKQMMPPVLLQLVKRLRGNRPSKTYGLSGDYRSWDEAITASTGYASEIILEKTKEALLMVKNGEAVHERDSVLFDKILYSWPLLAGLMWAAARSGGRLNVLDFGGSLGTTYFQNRIFLSKLPEIRWNIIEQARHVETGKTLFEDDHLRFYATIADCLIDTHPNVALLSGVLQCLEHPYTVFEQILGLPCDCVIIDRTPFWAGPTDRLCVQNVPPSIYPASYPSYIFSMPYFYTYLNKTSWQIMVMFDSLDLPKDEPVKYIVQGFILCRRKPVKSQL
jgi:putative methyltransferase (TIGR04325 family)